LKANDIGILKLSKKVTINPVSLSFFDGFPKQGRNVTVIGYGQTNTEKRRAKNLNQVEIAVRNWDDCYKLYGEDDGPTKICAGGNGKVRNYLALWCMFLDSLTSCLPY
jgi:Trypsin